MFSLQRQTSERVSKSDAFNAKVSHPSRTIVHPKLEVTEPGDHDEQEADAVANDVMSGKICRQISHGSVGGGMAVSSQMEGRLNSLQGGGQAMPDGLRSMMEHGFSRDFSQVRLHTDCEAASLSSSIHAKAFTHGNDIYFNQGQFSPNTSEGQKLMAHELTHVAQGMGKVGRDVITDEVKSDRMRELNCRKPSWDFAKCGKNYLDGSESESIIYQLFIAKDMIEYVISELPNLENDSLNLYKDYFGNTSREVIKNSYAQILNVIDKSLFGENELYIHKGTFKNRDISQMRPDEKTKMKEKSDNPCLDDETIAYVNSRDSYYEIALCPRYNAKKRNDVDKAAILIHELSHEELYKIDVQCVTKKGKTTGCYSEQQCKGLSDTFKVQNAQNYALFARDLYSKKGGQPLNRSIATEYKKCVDELWTWLPWEGNEDCRPNK